MNKQFLKKSSKKKLKTQLLLCIMIIPNNHYKNNQYCNGYSYNDKGVLPFFSFFK